MQIGTEYGQLALSLLSGATTSAASSSSATSSSLFGPATLLSLGSNSTASSGTYSQLGQSSAAAAFTQLDFSAVLSAKYSPTSAPSMSPALAQEESATLKNVSDLVNAGSFDEARGLINDLLKQDPTSGPGTYALGIIELDQKNYAKAERLFRQADYLAPDRGYGDEVEVARLLQKDDGEVMAAAKRLVASPDTRSRGINLLYGLAQRDPTNTDARILLASSLLKAGDGTNCLAQYRLAIVTADRGQLEQIETQLGNLVERAPKAAYLRRLFGQVQLSLGKNDEAANTLAKAAELANGDPTYQAEEAPVQIAIGRDRLATGDIPGALASFQAAESLDPTSPDVQTAFGEVYLARAESRVQRGSLSAAIHDFSAAANQLGVEADPALLKRLAAGAFAAGQMLDSQHRRSGDPVGDESIAFRVAYEADPTDAMHRTKWAEVSGRLGDEFRANFQYADAASAYQRAYDLDPNNSGYRASVIDAYTLSGDQLMSRHQYDDAISAYHGAYDLEHGDAVRLKLAAAYNERGRIYQADGKIRLARADYLQAVRLDGQNTQYQDNYNSLSQ
jgi:tetratricopeptide (TPR) repeat protein